MKNHKREVSRFLSHVELRIEQLDNLAKMRGIRKTARAKAAQQAHQLRQDLDYLRGTYGASRAGQ